MAASIKDYRTVAAGATTFALGDNTAAANSKASRGDEIERLVIVPATTSPGAVSIIDEIGSTPIVVYTGGTVGADLTPIVVELRVRAVVSGSDEGWFVTTGANVSVIASGRFQRRA